MLQNTHFRKSNIIPFPPHKRINTIVRKSKLFRVDFYPVFLYVKKILIPQFIQSSPPYILNMTIWFGLWFVWMKILKNNKQKWTNIYKVNTVSICIAHSTIRKCWILIFTKILVWATNYFNSKHNYTEFNW